MKADVPELPEFSSIDEAVEDEINEYLSRLEGEVISLVHPRSAILGLPVVDAESMAAYVRRHNPAFDPEIARLYLEVGNIYGIRGDVAFCQAILETGWFKFKDGTSVEANQFNFCGLGVLKAGNKGESFSNAREGVAAQIQHLFAYSSSEPLPEGEQLIDPRFGAVKRASASSWQDLSGRWAANNAYADLILGLYANLLTFKEKSK